MYHFSERVLEVLSKKNEIVFDDGGSLGHKLGGPWLKKEGTEQWCDCKARRTVRKIGAALERLGNEIIDMHGSWDSECIKINTVHLRWIAGTMYGFYGTDEKCGVRVYVDTDNREIAGYALKGSKPKGESSRYLYRVTTCGGSELPVKTTTDLKGTAITGPCYTSSAVTDGGVLRTSPPTERIECDKIRH